MFAEERRREKGGANEGLPLLFCILIQKERGLQLKESPASVPLRAGYRHGALDTAAPLFLSPLSLSPFETTDACIMGPDRAREGKQATDALRLLTAPRVRPNGSKGTINTM